MDKEVIKSYVKQIMDLEVKRLTLEKINEESKKKIEVLKNSATQTDKDQLNTLKQELSKTKKEIEIYNHPYTPRGFVYNQIHETLPTCVILLICSAIGFLVGYYVFNIVVGIILGLIGVGIGVYWCNSLVIWFNFRTLAVEKKTEQFCIKRLEENSIKEIEIEKEIDSLEQALLARNQDKINLIKSQINININNILNTNKLLDKYYALDIIPIDYRELDCIITLDHIFKNDLADTIRDAILLYQNWVFQGLIIKGLENIYKMLGNLSSQMQYMQQTLDNIDSSVSSMCSDMEQMISLQKMQNKTQEQILQETQCTRYATETIKQSNEKYEWYIEQHRQGLL